jgi:hypothetical protein
MWKVYEPPPPSKVSHSPIQGLNRNLLSITHVSQSRKNTSPDISIDVPVSAKEKELYKILVEEVTQDVLKKIRSRTIDTDEVERDSLQDDDDAEKQGLEESFEGQLEHIESSSPPETSTAATKASEKGSSGFAVAPSLEPRSAQVSPPTIETIAPPVIHLGHSNPPSRRSSVTTLVPPPPMLLHMDSVQPTESYASDLMKELEDLEKDVRLTLGSISKLKDEMLQLVP